MTKKRQRLQHIFQLAAKGVLLLCLLLIAFTLYQTQLLITQERRFYAEEAELVRLGIELGDISDFLTWANREFVVTIDPMYLQKYWHEVDINQRREHIIHRLKQLNVPVSELALLQEAKRRSDRLVETEVRAMKLILSVLGIPEKSMHPAIREYRLSATDQQRSPEDKLHTARMLMFDTHYNETKATIMDPITQFQKRVHARAKLENRRVHRYTNVWLHIGTLGLIISLCLTGFLMITYRPLSK